MRIIFSILALFCISALSLSGQSDQPAISIMDKFSDRALKAESITMEFTLKVYDALEQTESISEGSIVIKGNSYKLDLTDNIIWYDGSAIYTLVPEVEEVTITEPDPEDLAFISSPSLLFTMYKEGYKVRLVAESADGSIVDLYPDDLANDISRIRLSISKDYSLNGAEYKRKDGIIITIDVAKYIPGKSYKQDFFKFDEKKYKNVDVIDMRF